MRQQPPSADLVEKAHALVMACLRGDATFDGCVENALNLLRAALTREPVRGEALNDRAWKVAEEAALNLLRGPFVDDPRSMDDQMRWVFAMLRAALTRELPDGGDDAPNATRPTLYIAGPMTGIPEFNYPAFRVAKSALVAAGYLVLSPADNDDGDEHDWAWFMRKALAQIIRSDAVAVLPDSVCSKGALLEVTVARALGMDVRPVAVWERERKPQGGETRPPVKPPQTIPGDVTTPHVLATESQEEADAELDDDCSMCSGFFCAEHGDQPCDCDTAERHGDRGCPLLDAESWEASVEQIHREMAGEVESPEREPAALSEYDEGFQRGLAVARERERTRVIRLISAYVREEISTGKLREEIGVEADAELDAREVARTVRRGPFPEPTQEPVAWLMQSRYHAEPHENPEEWQTEDFAYSTKERDSFLGSKRKNEDVRAVPLYASPPVAQEREPDAGLASRLEDIADTIVNDVEMDAQDRNYACHDLRMASKRLNPSAYPADQPHGATEPTGGETP
jgi:hypothetical protein